MSTPHLSVGDIIETQLLVRQSAEEVVAQLHEEPDKDFALGLVVGAVAISEGIDTGRRFAKDTIGELALQHSETFSIWKSLYAEGDHEALPEARRALGLTDASKIVAPAAAVALVEAGDVESMALARNKANGAFAAESPYLLSRLYIAGDAESLDLAIEATAAANRYAVQTQDPHGKNERALSDMGSFAVRTGKIDDALRIIERLEDEAAKADLHAELFRQGRAESLQPALHYVKQGLVYENRVERKLAAGGHALSIENVERRVAAPSKWLKLRGRQKPAASRDITEDLEDLTALHAAAIAGADQRVAELIRAHDHPQNFLSYLGRVGLPDVEFELASGLYEADPSAENATNLLLTRHDNSIWSVVFKHHLYKRRNIGFAAADVRRLARELQK